MKVTLEQTFRTGFKPKDTWKETKHICKIFFNGFVDYRKKMGI